MLMPNDTVHHILTPAAKKTVPNRREKIAEYVHTAGVPGRGASTSRIKKPDVGAARD